LDKTDVHHGSSLKQTCITDAVETEACKLFPKIKKRNHDKSGVGLVEKNHTAQMLPILRPNTRPIGSQYRLPIPCLLTDTVVTWPKLVKLMEYFP
jgi:hypothetical protein